MYRYIRIRYWLLPFFLLLASCHKGLYPHRQGGQHYTIGQGMRTDSSMQAMLQPYKAGVDTQMQVVIGYTDIPLTKAQPESTLGNFVADAQLEAARAIDQRVVASVANYGGIRIPYVAPGAITRGQIYELMPFDNMLTIVEVPGSVLRQWCDHMAAFRGWPISGIRYRISGKKATDIEVNGMPCNDHIVYRVVTSDYIAKGGDNCDFLTPLKKRYTRVFVRDVLIAKLQDLKAKGEPLHPLMEHRISYNE